MSEAVFHYRRDDRAEIPVSVPTPMRTARSTCRRVWLVIGAVDSWMHQVYPWVSLGCLVILWILDLRR